MATASRFKMSQERLNALKIPFNKYGGMKFLERYVIKNILAYLRISVNGRDEIAMFRVLQLYPGIGKTRAQSFAKLFAEQGKTAVMNACKGKDYQIYILELIDTMKSLTGMNLNEQLEYLIKRYYPMVIERSIRQQKTNDGKKSEQLGRLIIDLSDAEALIVMAESYRDASHFLEDLVLDAAVDNRYEDKLNISTIHSAKGLEYDTVFVMDCIEGVTPRCPAGHPNDPEELRCMYVAVTRAKKELYLMVPEYYNMKNCHGNITHFLNRPDILATLDSNGEDHSFAKTADEFWL